MAKMTDEQITEAREDLEQQVSDLNDKIENLNEVQDFTENEVSSYLDDLDSLICDLAQHAKDMEYTEFLDLLKPMRAQMKATDKFCKKELKRLGKEVAMMGKARDKLRVKLEKLNG